MAAILAQQRDVEEEYLWSCALTATNKEYSWDPVTLEPAKEEGDGKEEGRQVKPSHRLLIKTAILMPSAKKDEVTVVEIESEGYNKQKVSCLQLINISLNILFCFQVTVPICAMKGGVDLQKYVDLLVPGPAKMKIIHGEGPINLVGSHCVEYFGYREDDDSDDDEEEGDTENEMETEEQEDEAKTKNKSGEKKVSPAKSSPNEKTKKESGDKKASPEKEEKVTPTKEDSKKRKASAEPKSAEKKAKI